jgi:hypothetical protein
MSDKVIIPTGGVLRVKSEDDPKTGAASLLFDIEIPVRLELSSEVSRHFFPSAAPVSLVELEDVDLGVSDWRELAGKEAVIPEDEDQSDAAIYLATVHNPVYLYRISFGEPGHRRIPAVIELEFDFRCVNPRPPELEVSFRVRWEIDFEVIEEED